MKDDTATFASANGIRLHYRVDGRADGPWLTFCNSLGTDLSMWDRQIEALGAHFRILRYDRRGHGRSATPPAPYSIDDLGGDVIGLLDALGIERTHFCGLSIGGLVGQWLVLNAPERLDHLVLCSTAAKIGTAEGWQARIAQVREHGMGPVADATADRWFTPAFVEAEPAAVARTIDGLRQISVEGYAGCCHALASADFRARLGAVALPVLAVAGHDDPVTTPADLQDIAQSVVDGCCIEIDGRHICNLESADAFNGALAAFLLQNR